MKQLILTFFLVILCYSLFFDKRTEGVIKNEINYMQHNAYHSLLPNLAMDTMNYLMPQMHEVSLWRYGMSASHVYFPQQFQRCL